MTEGLKAARLSTDGRIKDVRADHIARYEWGGRRTDGHVVDAGCNCGYGAAILADAGRTVTAIDNWPEGLDYARQNWDRPAIEWVEADLNGAVTTPAADAVVAFEIIEHLADPGRLLRSARSASPRLLASVPNEAFWPWSPRLAPVHHRHYRKHEFEKLLRCNGWAHVEWFGQYGPHSDVEPDVMGRTLVVDCR